MNYKNFKIILEDKNGKQLIENISALTFPEAVKHAYILRSQKSFEYEIISVKKLK